jgi:hypothetical protein
MDSNAIIEALEWAYDKAVSSGIPGTDSAAELAQKYFKQDGTLVERVNSLIRWEVAKSATSGFVTGLGGAITLQITIPANLASVLFIQLRLIAAIAHMGRHDVREDKVKTLAFVCLCGSAATEVLKEVGIKA